MAKPAGILMTFLSLPMGMRQRLVGAAITNPDDLSPDEVEYEVRIYAAEALSRSQRGLRTTVNDNGARSRLGE